MKTKKMFPVLLLFMAATLMLSSCSKQSSQESLVDTTIAPANDIAQLAQKYTEPIGSDLPALKAQYSNLSEADLVSFWQNIYRINQKKGYASVSETQSLKNIQAFNNASKQKFGTSFNKLSKEDAAVIFGGTERKSPVLTGRPIDPPPPNGCGFYYYPVECWKDYVLPYSPPFNSFIIVDYYQGDCDGIECSYLGHYNKLHPITPLGDMAIAMFLQAKWEGSYTKVLHKKSSAINFFGSIAAINDNLRMSNALISDE